MHAGVEDTIEQMLMVHIDECSSQIEHDEHCSVSCQIKRDRHCSVSCQIKRDKHCSVSCQLSDRTRRALFGEPGFFLEMPAAMSAVIVDSAVHVECFGRKPC